MKAAQIREYGDPSVITVTDIPVPPITETQVLVEVSAASLNPFDTSIRSGSMKDVIPLVFPVTLGGDFAGTVTEIGSSVTSVSVGDKVFGQANVVSKNSGAFAEFVATNASGVAVMPRNLTFEEAAAMPLAGVSALQALGEHINLRTGQKVFVHGGAGGIGSIAIQIARHIGAYIATTAKAEDADFVKELGADEVIDYTTTDFATVLSGFDAVFDTVGRDDFAKTLRVLQPGGIAVSMIAPPDTALADELGVKAMMQGTQVTTERLAKLAQLIEAGAIRPQVATTYPLEEVVTAFTDRESNHSRGKIVLKVA